MGNPVVNCGPVTPCTDRGNLINSHKSPGEHTICDINGNSLKLSDVKDGMFVKIRARNVHLDDCDYLYTSEYYPIWGMYFAIQEI